MKHVTFAHDQWGTQKISMGGFGSESYGGYLYLVCAICDSQFDVMSMFPNQRFGKVCWHNKCIFFYTHSPYFMCHCTECKQSTLQVRLSEENKLNATTQQFITATAKISGCALKQGSETHLSLRQSHLSLLNGAALRSCKIRAVENWRCAAGLAGEDPGLRDQILLNYTRIENAHKICQKTFVFCDVQKSTGP